MPNGPKGESRLAGVTGASGGTAFGAYPAGQAGDPSESIWRKMKGELRQGYDKAASRHLASGNPIYYGDDNTPEGMVVKEYPDGRRELVRFDPAGEEVVRSL